MAYIKKTDAELKTIARDLFSGQIFSDRHCRGLHDVMSSFMVLGFGGEQLAKELTEDNIDFIYEYRDKAGPLAVNGRPTFLSVCLLDKEDTAKMFQYYDKYKEFEKALEEEKL